MPTGIHSLKDWALPAGWDAARLMQISLASGETYDQVITDIADALSLANAALAADPLIGAMIGLAEQPQVEYSVGVSNGFEEHTEHGRPDDKRGKTTGHMLEHVELDRGLGWTWDFLRKGRRFQIDNDIGSVIDDLQSVWRKRILTRHFKSTKTAVGNVGASVPYADGGTADGSYVPPHKPDRAAAFDGTHNHFMRLGGITQANLETVVTDMWHHGHDGPYDLLVAELDIASWTNATVVTGYKPRPDPLVMYGSTTDLGLVGTEYVGVVETEHGACRLRSNARIPTKYWTVFKSYGRLDPRNPLWVMPSAKYGLGAVLLAGDHIREYPLENALVFFEFDLGVGADRTAAVCVYDHGSGAYVNPTIG